MKEVNLNFENVDVTNQANVFRVYDSIREKYTLVGILEDDKLYVGASVKNPKDRFVKKEGYIQAYLRAKNDPWMIIYVQKNKNIINTKKAIRSLLYSIMNGLEEGFYSWNSDSEIEILFNTKYKRG